MNKQITEDYCSFEIAKLLKEKGFDIPTKDFYDTTGENLKDSKTIYGGIPDFGEVNWNADPFVCEGFPKLITFSKPSQSFALKWLREVHNQIIIIKYGNVGFVEESILQWWWELLNTKGELHACNIVDGNKSYEEACEDSILYVLKNLI